MNPELRALARTNLGAYYLTMYPHYDWVAFQQKAMVPALMALARHEINALMILMPVRHSKTSLGTLAFLAWLTGMNPRAKNMLLSYSDKFAKRFGRKIVELVASENHQEIFPNCILSPSAHSGSYFT